MIPTDNLAFCLVAHIAGPYQFTSLNAERTRAVSELRRLEVTMAYYVSEGAVFGIIIAGLFASMGFAAVLYFQHNRAMAVAKQVEEQLGNAENSGGDSYA